MTEIRLPPLQMYYTPDLGEVPEGDIVLCGVCGNKCTERRNVNGPRGWAQAMSKGKSLHDSFKCPSHKERWHEQALKLLKMAQDTPSLLIANLYEKEAKEILETRKTTKNFSMF